MPPLIEGNHDRTIIYLHASFYNRSPTLGEKNPSCLSSRYIIQTQKALAVVVVMPCFSA